MSPCLEGALPQTLPENGAFPRRRGLEGTPHSRCLLPPPPPIPAVSARGQERGWTLGPPLPTRPHALDTAAEWLGFYAAAEPFRIGLLLTYSIPECERLEPRSGPNSISSPLAPWLHLPIHPRPHPSLLAIEGVTKGQSENSLTLLKKKEEGVHCPSPPPIIVTNKASA